MGDATKYPLADLIEALASELREANQRAVERPDKGTFDLDSATVELAIGWETNKKGGIDFQVFKLGGGVTRNNTSTLTVTIRPRGERPADAGQLGHSRGPVGVAAITTHQGTGYPIGDTGPGPRMSAKRSK